MAVKIQKLVQITDVEGWFFAAPPKGKDHQWKDGYSAKELAKFVTYPGNIFRDFITNIAKSNYGNSISADFIGVPEKDTPLPFSQSGPRNHDLLLTSKNLVIGIEAKVNEEFDNDTISKKYSKALDAAHTDLVQRINWMIDTIIPGSKVNDAKVKDLKYQLFTATAGTLLEAYHSKDDKISKCIFLVLSLKLGGVESKVQNINDFNSFVSLVCGEGNNRKVFTIDGKNGKKQIECVFLYKEVTTESYKIQ